MLSAKRHTRARGWCHPRGREDCLPGAREPSRGRETRNVLQKRTQPHRTIYGPSSSMLLLPGHQIIGGASCAWAENGRAPGYRLSQLCALEWYDEVVRGVDDPRYRTNPRFKRVSTIHDGVQIPDSREQNKILLNSAPCLHTAVGFSLFSPRARVDERIQPKQIDQRRHPNTNRPCNKHQIMSPPPTESQIILESCAPIEMRG